MDDRLWAGEPSWCVAGHLGQLSLPLRLNRVPACLAVLFTCVGWQVTLCDPTWQLIPHSSEMNYREELYHFTDSVFTL